MLWLAAAVTVAAGVVFAVLAADVWWQRRNPAGLSLAVMLVAGAWWGFAYALELAGSDLALREAWGDAKYVGIGALVPAWLVFVLQYTGRAHLVTRRRLAMLSLEPLLSILVLAVPATHDLIRSYPANVSEGEVPVARTGPLFWGHFAYSNLLVLVATGLFVAAMARLARVYVRLATVLLAAALLPWAANLLHNFEVGPFTKLDLTPSAFTVTGGVLVWGLYRQRLVNLQPIARSLIVETMADAVLVVDAYGRVVDANPAAAVALGRSAADLVGHPLEDLLPDHHRTELALTVAGEVRYFDSRRQPLKDRRGRTAGEVLVLRDVTDAKTADARLRHVLAERSRVADALQQSLVPAALPEVKGLTLAARYAPAGDGREIGGDFYDVFPVEQGRWAVVLGDVSGKGAEAAAMTALIRYTLRALAVDGRSPEAVLRALNDVLLRESVDERYATLAYAQAEPHQGGWDVSLCLAGHHPPLLRHDGGSVEPVGRTGTALGLVEAPELFNTLVRLRHQDVLCLFTDGLVEARRGTDLFGATRAAEVLTDCPPGRLDDMAGRLEAAGRQFRGAPLTDDLALLLMRPYDPA